MELLRNRFNLQLIILHHSEEGGVLLAGRVNYAAHGGGESLLKMEIFHFYGDVAEKEL